MRRRKIIETGSADTTCTLGFIRTDAMQPHQKPESLRHSFCTSEDKRSFDKGGQMQKAYLNDRPRRRLTFIQLCLYLVFCAFVLGGFHKLSFDLRSQGILSHSLPLKLTGNAVFDYGVICAYTCLLAIARFAGGVIARRGVPMLAEWSPFFENRIGESAEFPFATATIGMLVFNVPIAAAVRLCVTLLQALSLFRADLPLWVIAVLISTGFAVIFVSLHFGIGWFFSTSRRACPLCRNC
jgi:hypothetical protein